MKCQSLFRRSLLIGAVVFFLLPLLTGCAELYVTASYWPHTWVVVNAPLSISCEGQAFGTVFETTTATDSAGHCTLNLMELGANPLEPVYICKVMELIDYCCDPWVQIVTATPMIYPVSLGCGHTNQCNYPLD